MTQPDQMERAKERLAEIRARKDLSVKKTAHLKGTFTGFDGVEHPLALRYYQIQGLLHLIVMRRFVLGDDTGLGKTLEAIAALCYIWEREPNRKVVILTTKSAARQWVGEFKKFTTGVRAIVGAGTPAQRKAAREAFVKSQGPTVLVMGYRSAVQDFTHLQHLKGHILVADECFDYHTPVLLADGTKELIGKVVSKKMSVEVLSRNSVTGAIEPKQVVNWWRKPLSHHRSGLFKLQFAFGNSVRVTASHLIYSFKGVPTPAGQLKVGNSVQYLTLIPSEDQWQVILGGLLGDGALSFPDRDCMGVCFGHSSKQEELLQFKKYVLESLGVSSIDRTPNGGFPLKDGSEKGYARFRLNGNAAVSAFVKQAGIRRGGKKRITAAWLDRIGPLGLAVWLADDGSLEEYVCKDGTVSRKINFSTHGYSREEQEILAGWLFWKWGVRAEIKTENRSSSCPDGKPKKRYYLYLNREASEKFLSLLPGSLPGVEYKFPVGTALVGNLDIISKKGIAEDYVTAISKCAPQKNEKYVYDLEVEDNHNYFVGDGILVSNCTAFKNPKTQVHQVVAHLSANADRAWGLTATLIKNNLMEGYGIYRALVPGLFQMTPNQFMLYYCIVRMQQLPRSRRQVPVIVGYSAPKILEFRQLIDPYFIGRPKHDVASELPSLVSKTIEVDMNDLQEEKYADALAGLLEIGTGADAVVKETTKLSAIAYCQEIVDDLALIDVEAPDSPKLDALVDLLTEGDLDGEKVIVFSRFRKMVDVMMPRLAKEGIKAVRITGAENEVAREKAKEAFQNPSSDVRVVCITAAGSEAVNLQAAKAVVCYDSPWSAGDFIQLVGRMIRIGSVHDKCFVVHFLARGRKGKTVDHRVMEVLGKKMNLIEAVLGKRFKGDGELATVEAENDISDLFTALQQDAKDARSA